MANIQTRIVEKDLHNNAVDATELYVNQFADAVVLQSKTLATLDGSDEVQAMHVSKAREMVLSASQGGNRLRDGLLLVGSLFLGAALQGIVGEYSSATPRSGWFVFYFIVGVVGTVAALLGLFKK